MPYRTTLYLHGRTTGKGASRRNWDVEIQCILPTDEPSPIFSLFHSIVDDANPAGGPSAVVGSTELTYTSKSSRIIGVIVTVEGRNMPAAAEALHVYLEEGLSEFEEDEDDSEE